jgi:hypothetical protein
MDRSEKILEAEADLNSAKRSYLVSHGWKETCNTPGAFWLWQRDFSTLDASRMDWWEKTIAENPVLKNPSKPKPYGTMTVPMDIAIKMTEAVLENTDV